MKILENLLALIGADTAEHEQNWPTFYKTSAEYLKTARSDYADAIRRGLAEALAARRRGDLPAELAALKSVAPAPAGSAQYRRNSST